MKHLAHVPPSPFEGVKFERRQNMRYRSSIDIERLVHDAQAELAQTDEPAFLAFMLALTCGLRKLEIDRLQWSAFHWSENFIRIQATKYFDPKTEHSIGDVPVVPKRWKFFGVTTPNRVRIS